MTPSETADRISHNLQFVRHRIDDACRRADRDPADVTLVAVTKYADWDWVEALAEHHQVFGENRPQQLVQRSRLMPDVTWHLIGQLQRNKVRMVLPQARLIHSVDSIRLLERIAPMAKELSLVPDVLLQVNMSGEASKSGFLPAELRECWPSLKQYAGQVSIRGLTTMAAIADDPEETRPAFAELRKLRDDLAADAPGQIELTELSMGMSGDFEVAIEEGATLVRIGSRLFDGLISSRSEST